MWLDDYQYIEEEPQKEQVVLDEDFTETARMSVQGELSKQFKNQTSTNTNAIVVSAVLGIGLGLALKRSPITYGILGTTIGILLINFK